MFIAMAVVSWQNLTMECTSLPSLPIAVGKSREGSIGFIPVFETREQAEKAYPDAKIVEIMEAEGEE